MLMRKEKVNGWQNALRRPDAVFGRLTSQGTCHYMTWDAETQVRNRVVYACSCHYAPCQFAGVLTRKNLLCPTQ